MQARHARIVIAKQRGETLSLQSLLRLASALLAYATSAPALADIVSRADVSYFTVEGNTPGEIYRNILASGPRVGGAKAIASIRTQATQDGALAEKDGVCQVKDYVITLDFIVTRPRIANEQVLSTADRALWQQMNGFIAAHEEQHRSVWQSCAAGLEKQITLLRAASCADLGARAEALWQDMLASCDKIQRSFDDDQSLALIRQPFMRRALEGAE